MRTVRNSVFETNSSSCHSITLESTPKEIDEFNEGKRLYFYNYANNRHVEALLTIEELYKELLPLVNKEYLNKLSDWFIDDHEYDKFGLDGCGLPWKNGNEAIDKDFKRFINYFIENFDMDMLRFAFDEGYENTRFFSKKILQDFIHLIVMRDGCPILTERSLRQCCSYDTGGSQVRCKRYNSDDGGPLLTYADSYKNSDEKLRIYIEIRD